MKDKLFLFTASLFFTLNFLLTNCTLVYELKNADEDGKILEREVLIVSIYSDPPSENQIRGLVSCEPTSPEIVTVESIEQNESSVVEVKVKTLRLGRELLTCTDESEVPQSVEVPIAVIREEQFVDKVFPVFIFAMILSLNVLFGTDVTLGKLRFILSHPKPLITAAICQFILLPPVGLGLARGMGYEPDVGMGVLMVSCAPGGGISNTVAYLVDGEICLSIAMTFFSTAIAIGMMPLNVWIYARFVSDDPKFSPESIPYFKLVSTLVLTAVPVVIGMLLISKLPKYTKKAVKFAKPVVLIFMLLFIALAIYRSRYAFYLMSVRSALGACLLPTAGLFLGSVGSFIMRLRCSQSKTIAIEVAIQNAGLVIGMTLVAFEQPEADLNAMMPIYMALMTSAFTIPLMVTHYTVLKLFPGYRRICEENREAQEREKEAYNAKNSDSTRKVELDEVENDQKETLSSPA